MSRVFISYAREDDAIAERLYDDLTKLGAEPWIDKHDLLAGQGWRGAIRQAVRRSSHFIALISKNSVRKRGYVQREMREAIERLLELPPDEIYLIPTRLDESESPFDQIQDLHWVDLFPSYDDGFEKISRALRGSGGFASDASCALQTADPDAAVIAAYRVLFDRAAFQDPRIFEYALPEVQRAIEDVSAAFATGKLFSREGRLLIEVPPLDRLKAPESELAIQNIRSRLSGIRRTIGKLTSCLNIRTSSASGSITPDFYDMEAHLLKGAPVTIPPLDMTYRKCRLGIKRLLRPILQVG